MYYFIVNPNAGWGKGGRVWQVLSGYLEKHQVEYEAYLTIGKGDAREAARRLTCGRREELVLVGVGGDGTMNEILDGLCFGCPMTLGHIPAGTGNDLGRSLRLPLSPLKGLKHSVKAQTVEADRLRGFVLWGAGDGTQALFGQRRHRL